MNKISHIFGAVAISTALAGCNPSDNSLQGHNHIPEGPKNSLQDPKNNTPEPKAPLVTEKISKEVQDIIRYCSLMNWSQGDLCGQINSVRGAAELAALPPDFHFLDRDCIQGKPNPNIICPSDSELVKKMEEEDMIMEESRNAGDRAVAAFLQEMDPKNPELQKLKEYSRELWKNPLIIPSEPPSEPPAWNNRGKILYT